MGEGKNPGVEQLKALGKQHSLKNAHQILEKVQSAVAKWPMFAVRAEASRKSTNGIASKLNGPPRL